MMPSPELRCRIENPKGSLLVTGVVVDEQHAVVCPADYGYVPDTVGHGGRPLETIVCGSSPGRPATLVAARPVAVVHVHERVGELEVVVCVAAADRDYGAIETADDLPGALRAAIERFVRSRWPLDESTATIVWGSAAEARDAIDDAAARWAATVNGRG